MADDDLIPAVDEVPVLEVGRRLGIRQFSSLTDWYGSWSPRNDNMHAEGPWHEWVALARAILAHPLSATGKSAEADQIPTTPPEKRPNTASDPASDPVGTVRQTPDGRVWIAEPPGEHDSLNWRWNGILDDSADSDEGITRAGGVIIGAVPGTPAAAWQGVVGPTNLRDHLVRLIVERYLPERFDEAWVVEMSRHRPLPELAETACMITFQLDSDGLSMRPLTVGEVAEAVVPLLASQHRELDRLNHEIMTYQTSGGYEKGWEHGAHTAEQFKQERDEARAKLIENGRLHAHQQDELRAEVKRLQVALVKLQAQHDQAITDWTANDESVLADAERQATLADQRSRQLRDMARRVVIWRRWYNQAHATTHDLVRQLTAARDDTKNAREDSARRVRQAARLQAEVERLREVVTHAEAQDKHELQLKVRHLGREYGRASATIAHLRGQLARLRYELIVRKRG